MTTRDHIAAEIRAAMGRRQMTQAEFAKALNRSQPYVSERLNGDRAFDTDELEIASRVLGYAFADFWEMLEPVA